MGLSAYLSSVPWLAKPILKSNEPDRKQIILDPELIAFFEANTPSLRRKAVLESSVNIGLTKETAEELVSRRNFVLHPMSRDERRKYMHNAAEANCQDYQHVIRECLDLPVNWRDGRTPEDIMRKEDVCNYAKELYNTCLKTQVKLLYGLGYKISSGNSALDTEIRRHANAIYMRYYGTPHHPREPTQAEVAKIDTGCNLEIDNSSMM
ncbi:hypothetical protein POJ06DRAFT_87282 [Lipomyces tetrasporus]|uniref:Uncharacterized protein n=1 Tax=Lipomyces tetrasporus TaxID=54092 RepID=A0AAD7VT51_9ASCO|nr:uncharacterized protein POJ06DRAFT_87282 [Lipomyces tetrasporus]KAJ8101048.1 hypothetical protein POJ06DRAFT_87282 [Lipomyces tetrasporus]